MTDASRPTGSIERTFEVAVPVDRAWRAMTEPDQLAHWFFPPVDDRPTPTSFDLYGEEATISVLDGEPMRRFRYAETGGPVPKVDGYAETTVTFEDTGSGTRITITRSGFGDGLLWDVAREMVGRGLDESIADLVLYLEAGVAFPRHPRGARCRTGVIGHDGRAGVEVVAVEDGSFGARLGLQPGDLLVELGGAVVFDGRDLTFFQRSHPPGAPVEAVWVRDGTLSRATATPDPWRPVRWPQPVGTA